MSLSDKDKAELRDLWKRWKSAREAKDYKAADQLRTELETWGCMPPDYTLWHPVFEDRQHYWQRQG